MADDKLRELMQTARTDIHRALEKVQDGLREELEAASAPPAPAPVASIDPAQLMETIHRFSESMTQVQLLNLLIDLAGQTVPRALLFIRKGNNVHGWAGRGFSEPFIAQRMKKIKWTVDDFPELTRVIHQKKALHANFSDMSDIADQIGSFDDYVPFKSSFFPLIVKNKVAGVLYTDSGSEPQLKDDLINFYCYLTGLELTLVTSKLKAPLEHSGNFDPPQEMDTTASQPSIPDPTPEPEPEPSQFDTTAPTSPQFEVPETPQFGDPEPVPETPQFGDFPRRVSIPEIEPNTTPDILKGKAPETPAASGPLAPPKGDDEEDPAIKKARRVARVLVSDLKLYNEQIVNQARKSGNLYDKLRDDLDRSYKHYQERVSGLLPDGSPNFFKEELVRQLADGDPNALGPLPF